MKIIKFALPIAAVTGASMISFATPEFSKKEKTACATCHVQKVPKKADKESHALNAKGKCYGQKKSLADCK